MLTNGVNRFEALLLWHHKIGDHEIERGFAAIRLRFLAIACLDYIVSFDLKQLREKTAHLSIIVDYQNLTRLQGLSQNVANLAQQIPWLKRLRQEAAARLQNAC